MPYARSYPASFRILMLLVIAVTVQALTLGQQNALKEIKNDPKRWSAFNVLAMLRTIIPASFVADVPSLVEADAVSLIKTKAKVEEMLRPYTNEALGVSSAMLFTIRNGIMPQLNPQIPTDVHDEILRMGEVAERKAMMARAADRAAAVLENFLSRYSYPDKPLTLVDIVRIKPYPIDPQSAAKTIVGPAQELAQQLEKFDGKSPLMPDQKMAHARLYSAIGSTLWNAYGNRAGGPISYQEKALGKFKEAARILRTPAAYQEAIQAMQRLKKWDPKQAKKLDEDIRRYQKLAQSAANSTVWMVSSTGVVENENASGIASPR